MRRMRTTNRRRASLVKRISFRNSNASRRTYGASYCIETNSSFIERDTASLYKFLKAAWELVIVCSISFEVWAVERKAASNCDGAK